MTSLLINASLHYGPRVRHCVRQCIKIERLTVHLTIFPVPVGSLDAALCPRFCSRLNYNRGCSAARSASELNGLLLVRQLTLQNEKKRSERRKRCALAVVKRSQKFSPAADPLPGGAGRPKVNQLETVTTFTCKPSLVRIDARNIELSW